MGMSAGGIQKWADVGMLILTHGLASFTQIKAMIKAANPQATEEELNSIVQAVRDEAKRRKKISDDIVAAGVPPVN